MVGPVGPLRFGRARTIACGIYLSVVPDADCLGERAATISSCSPILGDLQGGRAAASRNWRSLADPTAIRKYPTALGRGPAALATVQQHRPPFQHINSDWTPKI